MRPADSGWGLRAGKQTTPNEVESQSTTRAADIRPSVDSANEEGASQPHSGTATLNDVPSTATAMATVPDDVAVSASVYEPDGEMAKTQINEADVQEPVALNAAHQPSVSSPKPAVQPEIDQVPATTGPAHEGLDTVNGALPPSARKRAHEDHDPTGSSLAARLGMPLANAPDATAPPSKRPRRRGRGAGGWDDDRDAAENDVSGHEGPPSGAGSAAAGQDDSAPPTSVPVPITEEGVPPPRALSIKGGAAARVRDPTRASHAEPETLGVQQNPPSRPSTPALSTGTRSLTARLTSPSQPSADAATPAKGGRGNGGHQENQPGPVS